MRSIRVHIPALLDKIREMSDDNMTYVRLSICDETIDQSICHPAFMHFEATAPDGSAVDYESIDAVDVCCSWSEQRDAV